MGIKLNEVNEMSKDEFTEKLGWIFEYSPWVAEQAWDSRPFSTVEELHLSMLKALLSSPRGTKLDTIRAHPDLGTRLAMTESSMKEQGGAGLLSLTTEEYEQFTSLNESYVKKFGFPFIMAVKGQKKEDILAALQVRVGYDVDQEWEKAFEEIGKITRFRLQDAVQE